MSERAIVHESRVGTYHPPDGVDVAWTINDARGYTDSGPSCDECGACECECPFCGSSDTEKIHGDPYCCDKQKLNNPDGECIGLSFAFVCLDGGESLCEACAEKAGVQIVPCDCGGAA